MGKRRVAALQQHNVEALPRHIVVLLQQHPAADGAPLKRRAHIPLLVPVTAAEFDSRLIPESYISLREVVRMPYASSRLDIEGTAKIFDSKHPVVIVNNQCVIVTGASLQIGRASCRERV